MRHSRNSMLKIPFGAEYLQRTLSICLFDLSALSENPTLRFQVPSETTYCTSDPASTLPCRIGNAPEKQDRAALPIADGEQEGMVSSEDWNRRRLGGPTGQRRTGHGNRSGGRRLGALLVHLYKGLVEDGGDKQRIVGGRLLTVDPGEIGLGSIERESHAERRELVAQVDGSPRDLEPW